MRNAQSRLPLAIINVVAFVAVVVVNVLATTLPLGGMTTGQLSDLYPNLFVPAGLTFSIWGLIYLLLAIYVVYCVISAAAPSQQANGHMKKVGLLFVLSCAANIGWIFSWQYRLVALSMGCMLILLIALALAYSRLGVGRDAAPSEKYLVHLPMSVYLGWITVATLANLTALLVYYKLNGFGINDQAWAIILIGVGVALGLIVLFTRADIFYAVVVDWAVVGILIKRTTAGGDMAQGIIVAAATGICLLSLAILFQIVRGRVYRRPS